MLEVADLHAYYGKSHILQGVDMHIDAGEVVSLLGRNGVGRSTTVKAIMGEVPPQGSIKFKGSDIAGLPSYRIAHLGLGYVPEHRDIFPGLTVRQNLMLGIKDTRRAGKWRLEDMLEMFPNLAARADTSAGVLSGGEKQMLTICRTLMGDPELIMIDEPTEGLAPLIVHQVGDLIAEIARRGVAILLVEQKLAIAMRISHRVYVMGHGRIVFEGTPCRHSGPTRACARNGWKSDTKGRAVLVDRHQDGFLRRHPHTIGEWNENNTLYLGSGAKARNAHPCLRLTKPGAPVSVWSCSGMAQSGRADLS